MFRDCSGSTSRLIYSNDSLKVDRGILTRPSSRGDRGSFARACENFVKILSKARRTSPSRWRIRIRRSLSLFKIARGISEINLYVRCNTKKKGMHNNGGSWSRSCSFPRCESAPNAIHRDLLFAAIIGRAFAILLSDHVLAVVYIVGIVRAGRVAGVE